MNPSDQQPRPEQASPRWEICAHEVTDEEVARRMQEAEDDPSVWLSFEELVSGLRRGS
jgi:hypothetical protein